MRMIFAKMFLAMAMVVGINLMGCGGPLPMCPEDKKCDADGNVITPDGGTTTPSTDGGTAPSTDGGGTVVNPNPHGLVGNQLWWSMPTSTLGGAAIAFDGFSSAGKSLQLPTNNGLVIDGCGYTTLGDSELGGGLQGVKYALKWNNGTWSGCNDGSTTTSLAGQSFKLENAIGKTVFATCTPFLNPSEACSRDVKRVDCFIHGTTLGLACIK